MGKPDTPSLGETVEKWGPPVFKFSLSRLPVRGSGACAHCPRRAPSCVLPAGPRARSSAGNAGFFLKGLFDFFSCARYVSFGNYVRVSHLPVRKFIEMYLINLTTLKF